MFTALSPTMLLRGLNSPVNVSGALDPFAPPQGRSMAAGEQASLDAVRGQATDALGADSPFHALSQALDRGRFADRTRSTDELADLESGVPGQVATARAGIQNHVGDLLSEGAAARETLPFALQERDRNEAEQSSLANIRYGLPATIKAQGDVAAAQAQAQGRIGAANAHEGTAGLRGLMDAFNAVIQKTGAPPDEKTAALLRKLYLGQ